MSYKKLLLFLFCCPIALQASEGECNLPAERYSPLVNWVMNKLSASRSLHNFARQKRALCAQEVNSSVYAGLFKKAQDEIGVPQEDVLPVADVPINANTKNVIACVTENKINVVCENFFGLPYGAQRITALHEAYHNKYHDKLFMKWMEQKMTVASVVTSGVTSGLMAMALTRSHPIPNNVLRITSCIAAPIVCGLSNAAAANMFLTNFSQKYYTFLEYRADRDAVISADCYCCVQQYKDATGSGRPDKYLQPCEIAAYAQQLKKENKICQVHASVNTD